MRHFEIQIWQNQGVPGGEDLRASVAWLRAGPWFAGGVLRRIVNVETLIFRFASQWSGCDRWVMPTSRVRQIHTLDELRELWTLDCQAYQDSSISFDFFRSLWRQYPAALHVLFRGGRVAGAAGIWPVRWSALTNFNAGALSETALLAELDLEDAATNWYCSGFVVHPTFARSKDLPRLLRDVAESWLALLDPSPSEFMIVAQAINTKGASLLRRSGFEPTGGDSLDGFPIFTRSIQGQDRESLRASLIVNFPAVGE